MTKYMITIVENQEAYATADEADFACRHADARGLC